MDKLAVNEISHPSTKILKLFHSLILADLNSSSNNITYLNLIHFLYEQAQSYSQTT